MATDYGGVQIVRKFSLVGLVVVRTYEIKGGEIREDEESREPEIPSADFEEGLPENQKIIIWIEDRL
ncbi:unnamed protein product [Rhizophagus irregularis]|nr:unnamed protein product [Rhizophagus irregularis]